MKYAFALVITMIPLAVGGCQNSSRIAADAEAATPAGHMKSSASAQSPIVIELYQSQGCSSCPPANAAVNAVAEQSGVIALSFAVTYWDRLGWKDVFADKSYTQRQYDYARALGSANVATPQIIINGKTAITGIKQGELARSIAGSSPLTNGPRIDIANKKVHIGKGSGPANVWLVRYDPRTQNVAIRSGENTGRTLPHKNIVRSLTNLGEWSGVAESFNLPAGLTGQLETVILLQRTGAGEIIAAKLI